MSLYFNLAGIVMDTVTPDELGVVWSVGVKGWDRPDTTEVWDKRPNADGSARAPGTYNPRDLTCQIWAEGDPAAIQLARAKLLRLTDINQEIVITEIDGLGYTVTGNPSGALYLSHPRPTQLEANMLVRCEDPRKYGPNVGPIPIYLAPAAPGLIFPLTFPLLIGNVNSGTTVTNAGTTATPLLIRFYGPLSSKFWLINRRQNKRIMMKLPITNGDYLEIDTTPGMASIRLNGVASRRGYLSYDSRLFTLDPGDTELEFGSDSVTSGYVTVQYAPASMG